MEELSAARQASLTKQAAALKLTVPVVWALGILIGAYEWARVHDLGFDALRIIVYLPMSIALLTAGVVVPVLNYQRYKRLVRQYEFNAAEQYWTLTLLHDANCQVVVHEPPAPGHMTYFGKEYPATIFTQGQQVWHFPLAV
jgi:hypothetical protein